MEWRQWMQQLPALAEVTFPRCLKTAPVKEGELHVFADASSTAYAAAAYLKTESEGQKTVRLVAAKAHVVQPQKLSIPRLELLAAELGVKLRRQVLNSLKLQINNVIHWTDSRTALYWILNDKRRLQVFVHNRVQNILRGSRQKDWRWTPTDCNPADLPTRGMSADKLKQSHMWKEGPAFLLGRESDWPTIPELACDDKARKEMKKDEQMMLGIEPPAEVIQFERYSSWDRIVRIVDRILGWRDRARQRLQKESLGEVWGRAERAVLKQAQRPLQLRWGGGGASKCDSQQMGFVRLRPVQTQEGLWRGEGRLAQVSQLPLDARLPILLPKGTKQLRLLLQHLHQQQKHVGGVSHLLSTFQARFYAPHARAEAFRILQRCVPCRRRLAKPKRPPPGPLPEMRLPATGEEGIAFTITAVDCAGPYRVKRARSYEVYHMLLFTCCRTRVVKIEWLSSLSVDAFLLALTRASARGVNPKTILSDNGGNFDGANRLLRTLWQNLPQDQLQQRRPEIQWRFNPPYASHFGGVFERLIGAAKQALYHALPAHFALTLEELATAFAAVEGILNSRPLAYVSTDPQDPQPLTPNHFLYGSSSRQIISLDEALTITKRWTVLQKATEIFLRRLQQLLRPHMQLATQKRAAGRNLQVGDIVTFFMPSANKKWPLARVEETYPGRDGHVRVLQLRLSGAAQDAKMLKRDVGEVALLLPVEQQTHPSQY